MKFDSENDYINLNDKKQNLSLPTWTLLFDWLYYDKKITATDVFKNSKMSYWYISKTLKTFCDIGWCNKIVKGRKVYYNLTDKGQIVLEYITILKIDIDKKC